MSEVLPCVLIRCPRFWFCYRENAQSTNQSLAGGAGTVPEPLLFISLQHDVPHQALLMVLQQDGLDNRVQGRCVKRAEIQKIAPVFLEEDGNEAQR